MDIDSLYRHSVLEIAYPEQLQQLVAKAAKTWCQFTELPPEIKRETPYIQNPRGTVGYGAIGTGVTTTDHKETFEITLSDIGQLPMTASSKDLLRISNKLLRAVKPLISTVTKELEGRQYPGLHTSVLADQTNWYLRYLHYHGSRLPGSVIAASHIDKSLLTLHLHESGKGLQYLDPADLIWKNIPICFDSTAIISGIQLQRLTGGVAEAACHRIIANHRTAAIGRIAIVLFVQDPRGPFYNKVVNGSLAAKKPGFNYNMPPDELNKLFTS